MDSERCRSCTVRASEGIVIAQADAAVVRREDEERVVPETRLLEGPRDVGNRNVEHVPGGR